MAKPKVTHRLMVPCPACGETIQSPRASMSRYVNLYICADCGLKEAAQGFFWEARYDLHKPVQPAGYDPWNQ